MLPKPTKQSIAVGVILAVVGVTLAAVLYLLNPETHSFYPRCPLYAVTGLQCAGCGSLRAAHCLLNGEFARAFAFNPILVLAVPAMVLLVIKREWCYNRYVGWGATAVIVLYSVWRNL